MTQDTASSKRSQRGDSREAAIRNVVGFAHEVRIHFHDLRVVFASVLCPARQESRSFIVRAWGQTIPTTVLFDDVARAAPVKQMGWQKQRTISAAQAAGVFEEARSTRPPPSMT
jgi:hypothetical protein